MSECWLVAHNTKYYPAIHEFDSYEEAEGVFNYLSTRIKDDDIIYIAKVTHKRNHLSKKAKT